MIHVHSSATLKQISGQKRKTKNQKPIRNRLEKIIYIDTCELWDTQINLATCMGLRSPSKKLQKQGGTKMRSHKVHEMFFLDILVPGFHQHTNRVVTLQHLNEGGTFHKKKRKS